MAERKAGQAVAPRETSTAVAVRPEGLPLNIVSSTIRIPRVKIGEAMSNAVRDGNVGFLDIYSATGKDDTHPEILVPADPKTGSKEGKALRVHVLAIEEGRSESVDDELVTYTLQGGRWISRDGDEAGPNSYPTQDYTVCLPDVDVDSPFKILFKRSSMGAASNINTALVKAVEQGLAPWELAFDLTAEIRKSPKFTWGAFKAVAVEANPEHVEASTALATKVAAFLSQTAPTAPVVDRPDI